MITAALILLILGGLVHPKITKAITGIQYNLDNTAKMASFILLLISLMLGFWGTGLYKHVVGIVLYLLVTALLCFRLAEAAQKAKDTEW